MASGDLLAVLPAQAFIPTATNGAKILTRGGDNYPVLAYDDTTDLEAIAPVFIPDYYSGGGIDVEVEWMAADGTVGPDNVVWQGAFLSITPDADDLDSKSFASFQGSGAQAEASASGETAVDTISFSAAQADSIAAGESGFFKLRRDADDTSATDSLSGDAQMLQVRLLEA